MLSSVEHENSVTTSRPGVSLTELLVAVAVVANNGLTIWKLLSFRHDRMLLLGRLTTAYSPQIF